MSGSRPHVVVLGGGPAGVGGAYRLRKLDRARVTLVEQRDRVGGNAGSFELHGQQVDFGSHRLHPACEPEILEEIRTLLGEDLLRRPRHGRIRLRGRWIHFPLKPLDLLLGLDPRFALGAAGDAARRIFGPGPDGAETFAGVLRARLGDRMCEDFYFPYARKIWGLPPERLSAEQARRRVGANSFGKLIRKVLGKLPGIEPVGFSHFYYPRDGYGAISEAYADAARELGAELLLGTRALGLERGDSGGWRVRVQGPGGTSVLEADHVWSTVPITLLARLVRPEPPEEVLRAASGIRYRAMLLVYLTLETDRFSEYDAHYFPGEEVRITRLTEPKNYAAREEPRGLTTLCAELPCDPEDDVWGLADDALGDRVWVDLERAGLAPSRPRLDTRVVRLRHAYPIYEVGYERGFEALDRWAAGLPGVLTYGRQGLFAHDNTHHALAMAYRAAECLGPAGFDAARWAEHRKVFETHVVED